LPGTFGYEIVQLIEKKLIGHALTYVLSTVVFGVLFAWLGIEIIANITQ